MATLAVLHLGAGFLQGMCQQLGARPVVLQQVKGHALGRLHAHAGQALERLHQGIQCVGIGHGTAAGCLERELHAAGQARHAGGDLAHLLGRGLFGLAHGRIEGSGHQVFQHVLVVR